MKCKIDQKSAAPRLPSFRPLTSVVRWRGAFKLKRIMKDGVFAKEWIGDGVIERRSIMRSRKSVGDRTDP